MRREVANGGYLSTDGNLRQRQAERAVTRITSCPRSHLKADWCSEWDVGYTASTDVPARRWSRVSLSAPGGSRRSHEVSGSTLSSIIGTYTRKPMNCKILVM